MQAQGRRRIGSHAAKARAIPIFAGVASSAAARLQTERRKGIIAVILPITLSAAAAAAILALWLMIRVGQVRAKEKIPHGDGGHPLLTKRMRAQLNYVESAPFVLILIAAIELSGRGGTWLAIVSGLYLLARIAHAFGMDNDVATNPLRGFGIGVTMLTLLGLAVYTALIGAGLA
jgi:uncharacterized protein